MTLTEAKQILKDNGFQIISEVERHGRGERVSSFAKKFLEDEIVPTIESNMKSYNNGEDCDWKRVDDTTWKFNAWRYDGAVKVTDLDEDSATVWVYWDSKENDPTKFNYNKGCEVNTSNLSKFDRWFEDKIAMLNEK